MTPCDGITGALPHRRLKYSGCSSYPHQPAVPPRTEAFLLMRLASFASNGIVAITLTKITRFAALVMDCLKPAPWKVSCSVVNHFAVRLGRRLLGTACGSGDGSSAAERGIKRRLATS